MSIDKVQPGKKTVLDFLNIRTISSGIIATIFGCTGPALIIIDGATGGGLTHTQTISWLFAVYFIGGILGILMSLKYKLPLAGAYSIAGAVLVSGALTHFSLSEAVGAYIISNIIIMVLGATGLIKRVMNWIPLPIIMGMIAGVMMRFATDMINSLTLAPFIAGSTILVYMLTSRFIKRVPPVLSALIVSLLLAIITNQFEIRNITSKFIMPELVTPSFSIGAIISIALPLSLIVICTENAQAIGILMAEGYKPPITSMAIWSSIAGFFASLFGAHAINIAGPMTAICATEESGKKEGRYAATVINGLTFAIFGLLAVFVVPFVVAMPTVIVSSIAGLAMIGVLLNSLKIAFSDNKFQMGAFFALIIGMSGVNFFNISAPLWAIIGSLVISFITERHHFYQKVHDETNKSQAVKS